MKLSRGLVGFFRTDVGGTILEANQALLRIVGYESLEARNEVGLANLYERASDRERLIESTSLGPVRDFPTSIIRGS